MEWDLGAQGLATLGAMSLVAGVVVQVILGRRTLPWAFAVATGAYFLFGIFVSEVWFGWATEEELQPNIDGLSYDEVLLIGMLGVPVAFLVRWLLRRGGSRAAS